MKGRTLNEIKIFQNCPRFMETYNGIICNAGEVRLVDVTTARCLFQSPVLEPDLVGSLDLDPGGKNFPRTKETVNKFNLLKCWMFFFEG